MKCKNFLNIRMPQIRGNYNINEDQKISVSFDTETRKGKPFLLCDSSGNVLTKHEDMIDHLLNQKDTLNTFYNLSYDKNAILKFLPKDCLRFFAKYDYCIHDNIYYGGVGAKSFDIAYATETNEDNKSVVDHNNELYTISKPVKYFDIMQFFKYEKSTKLEYVSSKYLNDHKIPIEDLGYNIENLPLDNTVIEYCIHDSELTKGLTDIVINSCNHIGMLFNAPYSCASLSVDYFYKTKTDIKPFTIKNPKWFLFQRIENEISINPRNYDISYYAYNAYVGGKSEVVKRGKYDNVFEYDVTSMYPYQMTFLEDCNKLKWVKISSMKELLNFGIENIAYGFLKINVDIPYNYTNLLPYKNSNVLKYTVGELKEYFTTIEEIKTLCNLDIVDYTDIEIINGWIGVRYEDNPIYTPFKDTINLLFEQRAQYKKTDFRNLLFKIILNSIYGKFIEVNPKYEQNTDIDLCNIDDYAITVDDILVKNWVCGNYFNPIYASQITALSRCMVYNAAMQKEDAFIATFTDSVISESQLNLNEGKHLGQWERSEGDLFMVGAGFYEFEGETIETSKSRTRGVHIKKTANSNILHGPEFDNIFNYGYEEIRVKKLKECVIQDKLDDFNTFQKQIKIKDVNFDTKRIWDFNYSNIEQVRKIQCNSKPLNTAML
ncbi:hypothetical protein KO361_05970 [Candidatus Woesearchaeota archaeon]|nr:hypothetical protein [Candidatus Woesearchaeota archaeon]